VACLWYGGLPFAALIALAGFGLAVEWVQLCRQQPASWPGCLVPAGIVLASVLGALGFFASAVGAIILCGGLILLSPAANRLTLAAGLPYIAPTALALLWLRDDPVAGWANVLFVLVLIWSSDIGAYLAGRLIGGPRLAPLISPGKTWSGAAGGLLAAIAFGWLTASLLHSPVAPLRLVALAVCLGVVSQVGDLFESMLKRHFGVKDSGRLIPGHGGLLDRLDALLAVAPVAGALALLTGRGVVFWQ
jgi:phosphatidate cytidylyltransferase